MTIEMTDRVVRNTALMAAPIDNEMVILGLVSNNYIALDEIGRRIWELLETEYPVGELCHRLAREYDATPEQIAADVLPFLTELRDEDILHVKVQHAA
jgi:hypothetical protein